MTDPILEALADGQLAAALKNADGSPNIYITQNPTRNNLTLTLTNGLSEAINFPPGAPVAYDQLPQGQSAIYIYLNGLIDNADVAGIHLSEPGWMSATFVDPVTSLQYLVVAPSSRVTMQPGATLTFTLSNVLVPGPPTSGNADIAAVGSTPLPDDVQLFVNIANPPQPGKQTLDLQIGFDRASVYTGLPQSLMLHLVNGGNAPVVPGGTPSWHGVTPTFQLTLVYGTGAGALTTVADAAQITVNISNAYGNVWQPPQRRVQGQSPYWVMQPDPNGGGTVLGIGEQASIEFSIDGIDATLPAGLDSALTVAYVSWHDVPGYNDGSAAVLITKRAGPSVVTFAASPRTVPFGQNAVQAVLTWDIAHATSVSFDAPQVPPAQTFLPSGSGPIPGGITVPMGTTLTLTAYKDISSGPGSTGEKVAGPADDVITVTAPLHIGGARRVDLPATIGSLASIVIPGDGTRAFFFQGPGFPGPAASVTKAAILDTSTHAITGTVDLGSLIPPKAGYRTQIECAAASPDGKTIHTLVSVRRDEPGAAEYYILPLNVAGATYGRPVSLGSLAPSGDSGFPAIVATPDGKVVYVQVTEVGVGPHLYALDAAAYATKGSWTWQLEPDQQALGIAVPVAASADGSMLLIGGLFGVAVADVSGGFTIKSSFLTGPQHRALFSPSVSPDFTSAYFFCIGDVTDGYSGLLTIAVDPGTGALSHADEIQLQNFQRASATGVTALSSDGRTLYVQTAADTLTAFDTTTYAAVPYSCGDKGDFMPMVMACGAQPGVLYCTGTDVDRTGTVSIVTLI